MEFYNFFFPLLFFILLYFFFIFEINNGRRTTSNGDNGNKFFKRHLLAFIFLCTMTCKIFQKKKKYIYNLYISRTKQTNIYIYILLSLYFKLLLLLLKVYFLKELLSLQNIIDNY